MDTLFTGNLPDHVGYDSWNWHAYNFRKFGRVKRRWGVLGSKELWISDPLALHYILVKEAYAYERPEWLLE
jgi:hypothetical protein